MRGFYSTVRKGSCLSGSSDPFPPQFTPLHWGWLKVLKVSQRNCRLACSPLYARELEVLGKTQIPIVVVSGDTVDLERIRTGIAHRREVKTATIRCGSRNQYGQIDKRPRDEIEFSHSRSGYDAGDRPRFNFNLWDVSGDSHALLCLTHNQPEVYALGLAGIQSDPGADLRLESGYLGGDNVFPQRNSC